MSQGFAREARLGVNLHVGETLYFTSNDTFTKADYPGLYGVRVKVQAAGGGGGAGEATSSTECSSGGGGGGGSYAESIILASALSASETITVGAAGVGGTAGTPHGTFGGNSSFGTLVTANGGGSGNSSKGTGTAGNSGGSGGAAGTGDFTAIGSDGGPRFFNVANNWVRGGGGGGSFLGMSATGSSAFGAGGVSARTSGGYGSGGGGAGTTKSQAHRNGSDGAPGIVIVEVLYERKIAVDEDIHPQYFHKTNDTLADIEATSLWTPYTPSHTNVTVGNGTLVAEFNQTKDGMVFVQYSFTLGSTSSISGEYRVQLPVPGVFNTIETLGNATLHDSGTIVVDGVVTAFSSSELRVRFRENHASTNRIIQTAMSATVPFTWTTNDAVRFLAMYRADI